MGFWRDAIRHLKAVGVFFVIALLSGCSSSSMLEPVGIGPDRDELKKSPCACVEIPQVYFDYVKT